MSQNVTLPATISAARSLAVEALASGSTVTEAAERAGVARETVSRWVHRDPERSKGQAPRRCRCASLQVTVAEDWVTTSAPFPKTRRPIRLPSSPAMSALPLWFVRDRPVG
jgi:hypothetical protein